MADGSPTNEQWYRLYEAAVRIMELSPWEWMNEAEIFGVQDPQTEEIGFVSVMGMLGEHYAVSFYPNPDALYQTDSLIHLHMVVTELAGKSGPWHASKSQ